MKILIVTHTFFPKYIGGTETCVLELAKQFISQKHKVLILTTDPLSQNTYKKIKSKYDSIDIITIQKDVRKYSDFSQTYYDTNTHSRFESIIRNYKPNVIHYHHLMHFSLGFTKIVKKYHIPQVLTLHDFWFQCITHQRITTQNKLCKTFNCQKCSYCLSDILNSGPIVNTSVDLKTFLNHPNKVIYLSNIFKKTTSRLIGKLKYFSVQNSYINLIKERNKTIKKALKDVDIVILPTHFLAKQYKEWGITGKKIIISSDGINTNQFKKFIKKKSDKIRFVYIGSIIYNKGLDILLKAWSKLQKGDFNLKIYGNLKTDIKYSTYIKKLSKNLENIEFCGTFPPDHISKIYAQTDVIIVPSRWFENAPLVLRNSRLLKIPAIAANLGSMPELIQDNQNGFLYTNGDSTDLARKINKIITNPDLINQLNKNLTEQKSIPSHAIELTTLFSSLIKKNSR